MAATDSFALRVVNDIVHDVAAAGAIAAPFSSFVLLRAASTGEAALPGLASAAWRLMLIGLLCLAFLVFSGAVRLRYAQAVIEPAARPGRTRGAVIKHAVFAALVIGGIATSVWVATSLAA